MRRHRHLNRRRVCGRRLCRGVGEATRLRAEMPVGHCARLTLRSCGVCHGPDCARALIVGTGTRRAILPPWGSALIGAELRPSVSHRNQEAERRGTPKDDDARLVIVDKHPEPRLPGRPAEPEVAGRLHLTLDRRGLAPRPGLAIALGRSQASDTGLDAHSAGRLNQPTAALREGPKPVLAVLADRPDLAQFRCHPVPSGAISRACDENRQSAR